jgi:SAM-dependent methyltransferase
MIENQKRKLPVSQSPKDSDFNFGNPQYYYKHFYNLVVGKDTRGILRFLSSFPHKLLERPFKSNLGLVILELGSGQNEHFTFVAKDYAFYYSLDLTEPLHVPCFPNFKYLKADAANIPLDNDSVDRIILTCLLLHLKEPEKVLVEMKRVLKATGFISIYLPPEPSVLLRVIRYFSSKRKARALGFEGYDLFIARDHITYFSRVLELIKYHFRGHEIQVKFRPFFLPSWNLNAVCIIQIKSSANST